MLSTILVIAICVFLLYSQVFAESISLETARQVAANWMYERAMKDLKCEDVHLGYLDAKGAYYIFNFKPEGFVIVAADDIAYPVIFYSKHGAYTGKNLPPQFVWMMSNVKKEILQAKKKKMLPLPEATKEWNRLKVKKPNLVKRKLDNGVAPLLKTKWGQGFPYNCKCPPDEEGPEGHVLVGCVAVAMGQIMRYYEYPFRGKGSHCYNHKDYGKLCANFEEAPYNWSNMPNSLSSDDSCNESHVKDVSTILYHLGVSVDMDYGPDSSGVPLEDIQKIPKALCDYFRYPCCLEVVMRDSYEGNWIELMKRELDSKRPVGYGGGSETEAHAFVLDGYEDSAHFHINWGWCGHYDEYFYLDDLTPNDHNFNYGQGAIIDPEGFSDDAYEENDTIGEAWYPGDNWQKKRLSDILWEGTQTDDDWYQINVSQCAKRVVIDCEFSHSEGDINIGLYDSSGNELAASKSEDDDEHIDYTVSQPGIYYIKVYHGDAGNQYDLLWNDLLETSKLIKYLLGEIELQPEERNSADANYDGIVNIADVITLIKSP